MVRQVEGVKSIALCTWLPQMGEMGDMGEVREVSPHTDWATFRTEGVPTLIMNTITHSCVVRRGLRIEQHKNSQNVAVILMDTFALKAEG